MEDYQPPLILFTALLSYAPSIWNPTKPISSLKKLIGPISHIFHNFHSKSLAVELVLPFFYQGSQKKHALTTFFSFGEYHPGTVPEAWSCFILSIHFGGQPSGSIVKTYIMVNSKKPGIFCKNSRNPQISKKKNKSPSCIWVPRVPTKRPQKHPNLLIKRCFPTTFPAMMFTCGWSCGILDQPIFKKKLR